MLKQDLTLQILNQNAIPLRDHCLKEKIKKVIGLMEDESGGKIIIEFIELKAKTFSYLIRNGSEYKKEKGIKKCVIKRKLKFENYKNCFEKTQLENKIHYLEKNKVGIDNIKKDLEEFIRNNKSILKIQQRFKSERHNVFT